ncbi:MAG: glucokinase [Gammaproteobacteria bacterium]
MTDNTRRVLAGDIGGTKTRLAIFDVAGSQLQSVVERTYPSGDYATLDDIIEDFLNAGDSRPDAACFGIAGPVRDNTVDVTNLPWRISAAETGARFRLRRVALLNDLEANAWGLRALDEKDFHILNAGVENPAGNAAIIAAGTGLGEAGMYRDGERWHPFATEGGHTDFSPGSELEIELLRFLTTRYGHVSWERLVSGPGLVNIHDFLVHSRKQPVAGWLKDDMQANDPAAAISRAAQSGRDALCVEALELFVRLYGVEAGNLALKMMASGGVYLGGGIAPKILEQLKSGAFMAAFRAKGRMQGLLEQMPVRVVLNDRTALYGPAVFAGDTCR